MYGPDIWVRLLGKGENWAGADSTGGRRGTCNRLALPIDSCTCVGEGVLAVWRAGVALGPTVRQGQGCGVLGLGGRPWLPGVERVKGVCSKTFTVPQT